MKQTICILIILFLATTASAGEWAYRVTATRTEMLTTKPTEKEGAALGGHWEYLKGLFRKGSIIFAGRTLNVDDTTFGLVVFHADDEKAARAIMEGDPAVQQGGFKATL